VVGGIDDALAVLVHRVAHEERLLDDRRLGLELVGQLDDAGRELPMPLRHAVALEVVQVERRVDAVLRRRHAEALRADDGQDLVAELVPHDDITRLEPLLLREVVAHEVRGRDP
jgi:hypothetical protein